MSFLIANKLTYHTTETTEMHEERNTRNVPRGLSNRLKIELVTHTEHVHEFLPNSTCKMVLSMISS